MRAAPWVLTAVLLLGAGHASAQCSVGKPVQQGCGQIDYNGCCDGQDLYWCEGGWICWLDCTIKPLCGWQHTGPFYDCGTDGSPAPGNVPPMACATGPVDQDGDGFDESTDCNDNDPFTYPGAPESCDGVDNDCSGVVDDLDADNDGYSGCGDDCDDSDPSVSPGAMEHCADGVDNDCDGMTDGADPDCNTGDDDGGDDDGGDDDGGDDDGAPDDDDEGGGDDDNPGLGVMCACRVDGVAGAGGGLALLALLGGLAWRRR